MALVYLGLGTNLGDKKHNLHEAISQINSMVGNVICVSSFYASKPWGFNSDNEFLNAVILVDTELAPLTLLAKTQEVEKNLGRTIKSINNYTDRLIDVDILLYDQLIINTDKLTIPHPLILQRSFVLIPLSEIAANVIHPIAGKSILELRQNTDLVVD